MRQEDSVFIIAEISANHGQDIEIAKKSILKAKEIGADAVKIQTYTADTITLDCQNDYFLINQESLWKDSYLYDLYQKAYTPWEWHAELFAYAKKIGITLFSTPFDFTAVDLLADLGNPIYKIASFEITDIPLIKYAASKGKKMIISTGIGTKEEIADAVKACHEVGNFDVTLLKCTSAYPAKIADADLLMLKDMKNTFKTEVGISDHTKGTIVPLVATTLGAKIIEKHFILDKKIGGPDASFSLDAQEFAEMIKQVRQCEQALGRINYEITTKKATNRRFRRSLFVSADAKCGEIITKQNIRSVRPGDGLPPKYLEKVLGRHFLQDVQKGMPLTLEMIGEE